MNNGKGCEIVMVGPGHSNHLRLGLRCIMHGEYLDDWGGKCPTGGGIAPELKRQYQPHSLSPYEGALLRLRSCGYGA